MPIGVNSKGPKICTGFHQLFIPADLSCDDCVLHGDHEPWVQSDGGQSPRTSGLGLLHRAAIQFRRGQAPRLFWHHWRGLYSLTFWWICGLICSPNISGVTSVLVYLDIRVHCKSMFQINPQYHQATTFALYIGCLIWFVMSLDKDYIKRWAWDWEDKFAFPSISNFCLIRSMTYVDARDRGCAKMFCQ